MSKALAVLFAAFAAMSIALRPAPPSTNLPDDPRALAAHVAARPTDWLAASALTEKALDAPARDRLALWRASYALASSLAPDRPEPRNAFARSGFFHWTELRDDDRTAVLEAYAPLLRDFQTFSEMFEPVFTLTGDLGYLRRNRPPRPEATAYLAVVAAANGRFDDYRSLRAEATPGSIPSKVIDARELDAANAIAVNVATVDTDDVPPYVEVSVDGALRAEGVVVGQQTFTAPAGGPGSHRVEVRLANPAMRNRARARQVRVVSLQAL